MFGIFPAPRPVWRTARGIVGSGGNGSLVSIEDGSEVGTWRGGVPCGVVHLDRCSLSQQGAAAAAGGAVITLAGGHTWVGTQGQLRIWNETTAAEGGDYAYTRSGNDLLVDPAAAVIVANALGAGHAIRLWDTYTELSFGDATRDIQLTAGSRAWIVGAGLYTLGTVYHRYLRG